MGGSLRELCKTTEFPLSASSRIFLPPAVSRIFVHRNHATFFIYMARIYGSVATEVTNKNTSKASNQLSIFL